MRCRRVTEKMFAVTAGLLQNVLSQQRCTGLPERCSGGLESIFAVCAERKRQRTGASTIFLYWLLLRTV
jgi:hypothetical protein